MEISKEMFITLMKMFKKYGLIERYWHERLEGNAIRVLAWFGGYTFHFDENDMLIDPELVEIQAQLKKMQKYFKKHSKKELDKND